MLLSSLSFNIDISRRYQGDTLTMENIEELDNFTNESSRTLEDVTLHGDLFGFWIEGILLVKMNQKRPPPFIIIFLYLFQSATFCFGLIGNFLCIFTFSVKQNKENLQDV